MISSKIQSQLSKVILVISALIISLFLYSWQGSQKGNQLQELLPEKENLQQVSIPPSFTTATINKLNGQLDSLFKDLQERKGFNGTVLITKYNTVIYKGAFGYTEFQKKDTLTTETGFQLASVSKQFTAMAIMILKEQGKLDYDDSVQQYLPNFPYKGITIRQLLTHRSGLPNYTYFSDKLWPDRKKSLTNQDVLNLMAAHKPEVYHLPNRRYDYSNTGYSLLASIVEQASDMTFSTFMRKNIFEPLQMKNTFTFCDSLASNKLKVATGHTGGKRKRTPDFLDTVLGDKGIFSTVEDLYKWDQALYAQKLVRQTTLEEAFAGSGLRKKVNEDYGFGWRIGWLKRGDKIMYHGGLWHGFNTYLLRNPNDHSAIIILSNFPNGSLRHVKEIQDILYQNEPLSPMLVKHEYRPLRWTEVASPTSFYKNSSMKSQL